MWVLLIMWTANFVTTSQQITFEDYDLCEAARQTVVSTWAPVSQKSDMKMSAVCFRVKPFPHPAP